MNLVPYFFFFSFSCSSCISGRDKNQWKTDSSSSSTLLSSHPHTTSINVHIIDTLRVLSSFFVFFPSHASRIHERMLQSFTIIDFPFFTSTHNINQRTHYRYTSCFIQLLHFRSLWPYLVEYNSSRRMNFFHIQYDFALNLCTRLNR